MKSKCIMNLFLVFLAMMCFNGCGHLDSEKPRSNVKELQNIKPLLNSKLYSAGKANAKTIESWFKKEMPPELYDIWNLKKDRIYLNGIWKLIKLENTEGNPESNFGLKKGYNKKDFNDSNWFNQPVPWMWNLGFPDSGSGYSNINFAGIGWYRKHVTISNALKNKCLVLHFEAVDDKCEVFVNGKKVAANTILTTGDSLTYGARHSESFSVDITKNIIFGSDNVIAVRVYDDGKNKNLSNKRDKGVGGIWQEVYIDVVPKVYQTKTLVSPDLKRSGINCKSFIHNASGKTYSANLKVKLSPWKSARYKFADFPEQTISAGKFDLKPGENVINYFVKIDEPVTWSPEYPNLYRFQLMDNKYGVIGQERFGFREVTVGKRAILINNIPTNLRCEQATWARWESAPGYAIVNRLGYMNRGGIIEICHKQNLNVNMNMMRTHSIQEPHNYQDIADELGIMIYPEEPAYNVSKEEGRYHPAPLERIFDGEKLSDIVKEKIRNNVFAAYNNPSVVMRSMGNELYDQKLYGNKIMKTYKKYCERLYDEYKKLDPTRPLTSSSGREATEKSCQEIGAKISALNFEYAKSDFHDTHNYTMTWKGLCFAEDDSWSDSYEKIYKAFVLDDGKEKAVFNGETFISSLVMPYHGNQIHLADFFTPHIKNGVFDRKWFVENCQVVPEKMQTLLKGTLSLDRAVLKFGYMDSVVPERILLSNARMLKDFIELTRRQRDYCAGFALNQSKISIPKTKYKFYEPIASYVRVAGQRAIACFDLKFNKNMFAGQKNGEEILYIINDHEKRLKNIEIKIFVKKNGSSKKIALASAKVKGVNPGEVLKVPYIFQLPDNTKSRNYYLTLEFYADGKKRGENFYENIYVMNVRDVKLKNPSIVKGKKIGIFVPDGAKNIKGVKDLSGILKILRIPSVNFADLKEVKKFDFVIIPPNVYKKGINTSVFSKWLTKGGKLICFEQKKQIKGLPGVIQNCGNMGWTVEPIVQKHPVFTGLEKENFCLWNGNRNNVRNKWLVNSAVSPMNYGVLASFLGVGKRSVMAASDMQIGKGLCLQSQFLATERFMSDSVATRLILNIFNYTLGDWDKAAIVECEEVEGMTFKIKKDKVFFVNLKPYANAGFKDEVAGDQKDGWTDQGPENDFRNFPVGKQNFAGIPFNIIDPAYNNGKSCIILCGATKTKTAFLPNKCKKIKIGRKVSKLFFLVTGAWMSEPDMNIGKIQLVYPARGIGTFATQDIPLITGRNIKDWWDPRSGGNLPDALLAWVGRTKSSGDKLNEIGAYIFEWVNPDTRREISYINFYSARKGVPILLGITGEALEEMK